MVYKPTFTYLGGTTKTRGLLRTTFAQLDRGKNLKSPCGSRFGGVKDWRWHRRRTHMGMGHWRAGGPQILVYSQYSPSDYWGTQFWLIPIWPILQLTNSYGSRCLTMFDGHFRLALVRSPGFRIILPYKVGPHLVVRCFVNPINYTQYIIHVIHIHTY